MADTEYEIIVNELPEGGSELILVGDLTIDHVAKIYDNMVQNMNKSTIERIRLKDVVNIDMSVIQVIISLMNKQSQENKKVVIVNELEEPLFDLLQKAGIDQVFSSIAKAN